MSKKTNSGGYKKGSTTTENIVTKHKNTEVKNKIDKEFSSNSAIIMHFYKYLNYYIPGLVVILTLISYVNVFGYDFVNWDDDRYVTGNPYITKLNFENIKYFFTNYYFVMYIPLSMVSYMFDDSIFELTTAQIFHSHNIILHIFNSVLLYFVVLLIIKKIYPKRAVFFGFISALIFAVHPMHTQSVSWISERKDVLHTFFYFIAIIFYMLYINKNELKYYLLLCFFFLLSLLSKTQAVTLPIVLILIDYLIKRIDGTVDGIKQIFRDKSFFRHREINEKIPLILMSAVFGVIAILAISGNEPFYESFSTVNTTNNEEYPFYENVLYSCYSYIHYIIKILIPNYLSVIHPYPTKDNNQIPLQFWLYIIPILLLVAYTVYAYLKNHRFIVFSILFFTANIILMLQLASVQNFLISEHYAYISSIGISFLLIHLHYLILEKNANLKNFIYIFWGGYIIFLTIFAFQRNKVWENSLTLWDDVRQKYPNVLTAHYNRGNYNQALGDSAMIAGESTKAIEYYNEAVKDYDNTIKLHNTNIGALSNRGITKAKLNDPGSALLDFDAVIAIDSTYSNVFSNKGNALIMLSRWDEAITAYSKSVYYKPNFADAYYNRANAFLRIEKYQEAISDYLKALELNDKNLNIYVYIGFSYYSLKKYTEAKNYFDTYLKYDTNNYSAYYYLAQIYLQENKPELAEENYKIISQRFPEAVDNIIQEGEILENRADYSADISLYMQAMDKFNEAIKINPNSAKAHIKRGVIYGKTLNYQKALQDFTTAIKLDSTNYEAYTNRGFAHDLNGNTEEAIKDYSQAIKLNNKYLLAFYNRGAIYMRQKKYEAAITEFTTCINIDANYSTAYLNRGVIYNQMNKNVEACSDWQKTLQLGNKNAEKYLLQYCK